MGEEIPTLLLVLLLDGSFFIVIGDEGVHSHSSKIEDLLQDCKRLAPKTRFFEKLLL